MAQTRTPLQTRITQNHHAARYVCAADLAKEALLYSTKWFDYRFTSPLEATMKFRSAFSSVFRRKYRVNFDRDESEHKTGVSTKPSSRRLDLTSHWRARQFADELGVTYEIFLEAAFEVLLARGWTRLPYANQLYGKRQRQAISDATMALWRQKCESVLTFSAAPQYREESYRGIAAQDAHREWVLAQLKSFRGRPFSIGSACSLHRVLPIGIARVVFGTERVDRAVLEVADREPAEHTRSPDVEILPSCFGLPTATDAGSQTCQSCPAFKLCLHVGGVHRTLLLKHVGSDDPVHDRERAQQRTRTRKFRARAKRATSPLG
jgi:hypothetical protein